MSVERSTETSIEEKDEDMSIDEKGETSKKGLESVFEKKAGDVKKSKTRKRLANAAKIKKEKEDET